MQEDSPDSGAEKRKRGLAYAWKRAFVLGLPDLLLGLWVRRSISKAGIITVTPGWPLPKIINTGGHMEVSNCRFFPGVRIECWKGAVLKIGKGTYLNRGAEIVASKAVYIGSDCKIARDVMIMDTDQHPTDQTGLKMSPVVLEDRVWLGSRVIILKGVRIGHDSIVGAGAIVTKSVPPYSVVVGPAAQVIKQLRAEEDQQQMFI